MFSKHYRLQQMKNNGNMTGQCKKCVEKNAGDQIFQKQRKVTEGSPPKMFYFSLYLLAVGTFCLYFCAFPSKFKIFLILNRLVYSFL